MTCGCNPHRLLCLVFEACKSSCASKTPVSDPLSKGTTPPTGFSLQGGAPYLSDYFSTLWGCYLNLCVWSLSLWHTREITNLPRWQPGSLCRATKEPLRMSCQFVATLIQFCCSGCDQSENTALDAMGWDDVTKTFFRRQTKYPRVPVFQCGQIRCNHHQITAAKKLCVCMCVRACVCVCFNLYIYVCFLP